MILEYLIDVVSFYRDFVTKMASCLRQAAQGRDRTGTPNGVWNAPIEQIGTGHGTTDLRLARALAALADRIMTGLRRTLRLEPPFRVTSWF